MKQNDGTIVDPASVDQTSMEVTERFEGLTQDLVQIHGIWKFAGTEYKDELIRFRVETRDPQARASFKAHKEIWNEKRVLIERPAQRIEEAVSAFAVTRYQASGEPWREMTPLIQWASETLKRRLGPVHRNPKR